MEGTQTTLPIFILFVIIAGIYIYNIISARKGLNVNIRPIKGLVAIDEAIGRAVEMGRPIHFTLGISRFFSDTFAAFAILRHLASKCAEMGAYPIITNSVVTVHLATEEIVRSAYMASNYPDRYRPDMVRFIAKDPFAYSVGALDVMRQENVASNIMIGTFGSATLLMAEGGRILNTYQIAGTDDLEQLPFYFISCDYTLIGEEIYGAGAHLSGDKNVLGCLRGEDWLKIGIIALILAFTVLGIIGINAPLDWFSR
jgi:hypothetical protein